MRSTRAPAIPYRENSAFAAATIRSRVESESATVAQLALAWLLAQGEDIVPIPGTRSATRVEENAGAAGVDLTSADLRHIVEILPHGSAGSRYPAAMMPTDW
jgi:aryl-alcohol dehydrogenase-like predicted oxidoreductase